MKLRVANDLIFRLGVVLSVGIALLMSNHVGAVSEFDDALNLADPALMLESYESPPRQESLINLWASKITVGPYCSQEEVDSWNNREDWAVIQNAFDSVTQNARRITVTWTEVGESSPTFIFEAIGSNQSWASQQIVTGGLIAHGAAIVIDSSGNYNVSCGQSYGSNVLSKKYINSTFNSDSVKVLLSTFDVEYPTGYEGEPVPGNEDADGDMLVVAREAVQGTSDASKDTDSDGLSDYIESQWYPNRQAVFCGTSCAYPNPTQRDIYVEIDWMKNLSNQVYKPTNTQLALVEDMYADKEINFHVDTGQFGGGNELAVYTHSLSRVVTSGQVDFWDYKNGGDGITANFSPDRNLIWRYMIYGYEYSDPNMTNTTSGWSEVMGDDIFISGGWINNLSGLASLDRAIANTIAHETGHALCLSSVQVFVEQPAGCLYDGIDNDDESDTEYNLENYKSVMNYRYQLTDQDDMGVVDYSDGSHGAGDYDDWNGVLTGMGGFAGAKTALGAIAKPHYITPDGGVIILEAPIDSTSLENRTEDLVSVVQADSQQHTGNGASEAEEDVSSKVEKAESINDSWVDTGIIVSSIVAASLLMVGVIVVLKRRA